MVWLQDWVRTIIVLVIFAGFLELLLPSGNMKSTVQVLVGLFVLTLLLNPITAIIGRISYEPEIELPVLSETETSAVLAQGEHLREKQLEYALAEYKINIAQQIKSLLELRDETLEVEVIVNVVTDPNQNDFGQLSSLNLNLRPINWEEKTTDTETLAAWLADFYGLTRDKVIVTLAGNKF
ncbi:MAG: stage III sporulation protein AF [bacterium]|jgi:stage III sporulation protein AF